MRLLLIEDEQAIAEVVRLGLEEARYTVDIAQDGETGLRLATERTYSLILLDVMLPRRDGWSVCRELRARRDPTPILMLTARDAITDRVKGLDLGADDYLPKPFDFDELLARVRALLRRNAVNRTTVIRVADLEIDTQARTVTRAGRDISLSPREYDLLAALASHEGQVLTRDAILDRVWMDEDSASNVVDVYIGLLRKKIDAGRGTRLIQTVHGVGYRLRVEDDEVADGKDGVTAL